MFMMIAFAIFGAVSFWFPKVFGIKLDDRLGKVFFWFFTAGSLTVFIPMYILGFMGMTRRLEYIADIAYKPLLLIELLGIVLYAIGIFFFVAQVVVTLRNREKHRVTGPDPWGTARSLEWATHSPTPFYNFAVTPLVHARDEWAWRRELGLTSLVPERYTDIHMPKNTAVPVIIGGLSFIFGFAMVWRIWWLAALGLFAIIAAVIIRSFNRDIDYVIPAAEVERMERELQNGAEAATPVVSPVGAGGSLAGSSAPLSARRDD
jgi:cytochrome o ubiquinol oxidase subunit 1